MRTYDDLIKELGPLASVEQGSSEWKMMRLGVATASKAKEFLAKRDSATYQTYLAEKAAEVCTGDFAMEITAKALQWGKEHESSARALYEFETGFIAKELPFIYRDQSKRFGCSPDGLTMDAQGFELKCPVTSAVFLQFVCADKIKPEYYLQCQFSMWVSGRDEWHFANYDPRMKTINLHWVPLLRDEVKFREFDARAEEWIKDMDIMLEKMGLPYGSQFEALNG